MPMAIAWGHGHGMDDYLIMMAGRARQTGTRRTVTVTVWESVWQSQRLSCCLLRYKYNIL